MKKQFLIGIMILVIAPNHAFGKYYVSKEYKRGDPTFYETYSTNKGSRVGYYFYTDDIVYPIVCKVFQATSLELEAGEELTKCIAGDTKNWAIDSDARSNSGTAERAFVIIKPLSKDRNLNTNLTIFTTERVYLCSLSTGKNFMLRVKWAYQKRRKHQEEKDNIPICAPVRALDYKYKGKLNRRRIIVFVYTVENKTYIELPEEINEFPVLYVPRSGDLDTWNPNTDITNYRKVRNFIVVDSVVKFGILKTLSTNDDENTLYFWDSKVITEGFLWGFNYIDEDEKEATNYERQNDR